MRSSYRLGGSVLSRALMLPRHESRRRRSTPWLFSPTLASDFDVEETQLLPLLVRSGGSSPLLEQVLTEHEELRGMAWALQEEAAAGDVSGETMARLADLLDASVRREERELFPLIEQTVSDGDLRALDLRSSLTAAADG